MINLRSYFRRSPILGIAWFMLLMLVSGVVLWVIMVRTFGYEKNHPIQSVSLAISDYEVTHVATSSRGSMKNSSGSKLSGSEVLTTSKTEHHNISSSSWRENAAIIKTGIESKPKISLVLTGLGLNNQETASAITDLPPEISLAFLPYTRDIEQQLTLSKQNGHENLILIPMEPMSFPDDDPGPGLLLTGMTAHELRVRFAKLLGESKTFVGIVNSQGSRFIASSGDVQVLFSDIKKRKLIFVEQPSTFRSSADKLAQDNKIPFIKQSCIIDLSDESSSDKWYAIANTAKQKGYVSVSVKMQPGSVELIKNISEAMVKDGIELVPVTYSLQTLGMKVSA